MRVEGTSRTVVDDTCSGDSADEFQTCDSVADVYRKIAFGGFPDAMVPTERYRLIEKFLSKFPDFRATSIDCVFKSPRSSRVPTRLCLVEFSSADKMKAFLDQAKSNAFVVAGATISLEPALSKINAARNWALKEASRMVISFIQGLSPTRNLRCLSTGKSAVFYAVLNKYFPRRMIISRVLSQAL